MTEYQPLHIEHFGPKRTSLRIAVVSESKPTEVHGIENSVSRLIHGLQSKGHELTLIYPTRNNAHPRSGQDDQDFPAPQDSPIFLKNKLKLSLPAKDELNQLWMINRPDVILIATEGPFGWSALKVARKLKIPSITDFRTKFYTEHSKPGLRWLRGALMAYLRKFHNSSQCTLVPNLDLKKVLTKLGFHNLEILPQGVNSDLYNPDKRSPKLRADWGASEKDLVMMYIISKNKDKHLKSILRLHKLAKSINPSVKLVLVNPKTTKFCSHKIQQNVVVVRSALMAEEWPRYLASADLLICPSTDQGINHKIMQAMSSGLVVLTHSNIELSEFMVNNVNSLLVKNEQENEFRDRLLSVIDQDNTLKEIKIKARQTASQFEWTYVIDQTHKLFHTVSNQLI
jgi:glycosyltransferase involved in cell wall biosynthesis